MTRVGRKARKGWGATPVLAALLCWCGLFPEGASADAPAPVDLSRAVVVAHAQLSGPERKALDLLTDEVHRRTLVRWEVAHTWPVDSVPVIALGPASRVRVAYLASLDGFLRGHSCWRWQHLFRARPRGGTRHRRPPGAGTVQIGQTDQAG